MTFTYEYLRKFQNYLEGESGAHMGVMDEEKKIRGRKSSAIITLNERLGGGIPPYLVVGRGRLACCLNTSSRQGQNNADAALKNQSFGSASSRFEPNNASSYLNDTTTLTRRSKGFAYTV